MANNVSIKNSAGVDTLVKTTDNAGVHTPHHNIDSLPSLPAGNNNIGDVDVVSLPALPAGTNNIGDVDILSLPALPAGTNNIGDVDVLSLPAIPAGTNNIGDVDIASIAAGENHVGKFTTVDDVIAVTPTLDTSAYAAGDVFFVPTEITGFARTNGGIVTIVSVAADDKDDQGMPFDLLFLDSNTSIGTINTAVNLSGANAAVVRATVSSGTWLDLGGARHSTFFVSPVKVKVAAAQTSIWVAAIARAAGTFTAAGLILYIGIEKS